MTTTDDRTRLRECRRLARSYPDKTAKERLERIAGVASGKIEPGRAAVGLSADVHERIAAGQASRAKGNAHDRIKTETKRKKRGTRNRQERGGHDRIADTMNKTTDFNG